MSSPRRAPLTFDDLAHRLVRDLAKLVHSGATSERRLARVVGISQPHLHNVLNGTRKMTQSVADQVFDGLDWSVLDLIETAEANALLERREASKSHGREIPLARFAVGPGFRFPGQEFAEITVPNSWLARARNPVAVEAGEDAEMDGIIEAGGILLIDRSDDATTEIHQDALYVVRWENHSVARWVRFSARGLYLVSAANWIEPLQWTLVVKESSRRAEVIEGKVIALLRPLDRKFQRPAQPFASN